MLKNMEAIIRDARPEDADAISHVNFETWKATYPNEKTGITVTDIEILFKDVFSPENIEQHSKYLQSLPSNQKVLVAEVNSRIVAFCHAQKAGGGQGNRLKSLYVLPEFQGRGIGSLLWNEVKNFFDPASAITTDVATQNSRAIAFYENLGFKDTGERLVESQVVFASGAKLTEARLVLMN